MMWPPFLSAAAVGAGALTLGTGALTLGAGALENEGEWALEVNGHRDAAVAGESQRELGLVVEGKRARRRRFGGG